MSEATAKYSTGRTGSIESRRVHLNLLTGRRNHEALGHAITTAGRRRSRNERRGSIQRMVLVHQRDKFKWFLRRERCGVKKVWN
uniref:Uncharacterized protein n=1 Tax=Rhizophora mucronata TaxID=61149 RepID=A0A2P2J2G0_RHIMU